jgi:hypothetical protein
MPAQAGEFGVFFCIFSDAPHHFVTKSAPNSPSEKLPFPTKNTHQG